MRETPIYLDVPFVEKDQAKALDARWDGERRRWYARTRKDALALWRWLPAEARALLAEEKARVDAEAAQREQRHQEALRWEAQPPRAQSAAEILRLAGLQNLRPVKTHGFCHACDSGGIAWYVDAKATFEVRHLAEVGGALYPSEIRIIEAALDAGLLPTGTPAR